MKKLSFIFAFFPLAIYSCRDQNLHDTTWKFCGDQYGYYPDVLIFDPNILYVKNDSIFYSSNDSAIGILDSITYYYGERRLYIRDLYNNTGRYCEQ